MLKVTVIGQGPYVEKRDIQIFDGVTCVNCAYPFCHGTALIYFTSCNVTGMGTKLLRLWLRGAAAFEAKVSASASCFQKLKASASVL